MPKKGKIKVPKRIAGVKVPKKLRKGAKKALDHPVTLELAAAALTAAAAALRARTDGGRDAAATKDGVGTAKDRALELSDVVIAAALNGARKLLDGIEAPAAAAEADATDPPAARPKPKRGRASGAAAARTEPRDA